MHCIECGAALPAQARFCATCGTKTGQDSLAASQPLPAARARAQTTTTPVVVAGAVIGVIILFAVIGEFARNAGPTTGGSPPMKSAYSDANDAMHKAMTGGLSDQCTPGKFKIREKHGTTEYGYVTVVEWPASVSNIGAHQNYQFKLMASAPEAATKYSVVPTDVRHW